MKSFITGYNIMVKKSRVYKWGLRTGVLFVLTILWDLTSRQYSGVMFPSPDETLHALLGIIGDPRFLMHVSTSLYRLFAGLMVSAALGTLLGICMGTWKTVTYIIEPVIYIVQAVPPILYMALAMLWFGLSGTATICIVVLVCTPIMVVNVCEGFHTIDQRLLEMGRSFSLSRYDQIRSIILPSLSRSFTSGLIVILGIGWKMVIMGEFLSASVGIGAMLSNARINLETDKVFAWGFIVSLLCICTQKISAYTITWRKKYE